MNQRSGDSDLQSGILDVKASLDTRFLGLTWFLQGLVKRSGQFGALDLFISFFSRIGHVFPNNV